MMLRIMDDIRGDLPALPGKTDPYRTTLNDLAATLSAIATPTASPPQPTGLIEIIGVLGSTAWRIRDLETIDPEQWTELYCAAIDVMNATEHLRQ